MISTSQLKEFLSYDIKSGNFIWVKPSGDRVKAGDVAGCKRPDGYICIKIGRIYLAHRLAFIYMNGDAPQFVDHINGNRSDNRWENLRPVTRSENGRNMSLPITNKSGVMGVFWNTGKQKWTARIKVEQKDYHLGHFNSLEDAAAARSKAEEQFKFHENHGRHQVQP